MRGAWRRKPLRIIAGAGVIALICWLVVDSTFVGRRKNEINRLLALHRIGNIDARVEARLEKIVPWLAAAAGVRERVIVDAPFGREPALHVFVTSADEADVTHCGSENAVYDASLDAIFIDREIVDSTRWKEALTTPDEGGGLDIPLGLDDVPSLRVYERFVILHELAHRQKHRRTGAFFDFAMRGDPKARSREDEADTFALQTMPKAYAQAVEFGVQAVEPYTGDAIDYRLDGTEPLAEQVQASLVEMTRVVLSKPVATDAARTPYAETRSHASTFERCRRLVAQSLRTPMADVLRRMTLVTYGALLRMGDRAPHLVTVSGVDPVVRIFFDAHGLVLCGARLRIGQRRRPLPCRTTTFQEIDHARPETVVHARATDLVLPASYWHTVAATVDGAVLDIRRDEASILRSTSRATLPIGSLPPLPGPLSWAVLIGAEDIVSLDRGRVVSRVRASDLAARIRAAGAGDGAIDWSHPSISDPYAFVPTGFNGMYRGTAAIDLRNFTVPHAQTLVIDRSIADTTASNPLLDGEAGAREMICLPDRRCFIVNLRRLPRRAKMLPRRASAVEVWEVSAARPPVLRAAARLLVETLNDAPVDAVEGQFISPRIANVQWVPPVGFAINIDGDSVYLFDASTSLLTLAYHPGLDTMRMSVSARGDVAVNMPGTRQVFVFRAER